uniref:I-type lectin-like protein 5 n=1 Tax=Littorina littorea TaxID=31216 RepID=A0A0A7RPV9_LITLI|nr:I-type lectin-like protein 5 [Littorina littorea]
MLLVTCLLTYLAGTVLADDPIVTIIETNPVKDPIEQKIISEKNFDVQLTCVVENRPRDKEVQWIGLVRRNNSVTTVPISTSTRSYDAFKYSIDLPSPTSWRLRIQNAQVTDEGKYTCQVQVSNQNYAKAEEELVIVEEPQIADLETSSDVSKSEGESLTLKCHATGRPTPLTKWTRMAGELLPSGGREHLLSDLVIPLLTPDHAGIYKCSAINSAGEDYRDIRVTVNYAPQVSSGNAVVQQAVGYVKELVCNIKGYPTPKAGDITWTKRGSALGLDGHIYRRNIPGASSRITSILVFWGVREDDYGEYTCASKNEKGAGSFKFQLQRSATPTEDRTGTIRAGASMLVFNIGTIIMLLSVCLLQRLGLH